jgi:hypothetical protein
MPSLTAEASLYQTGGEAAAGEVFDRILQMTDNAGTTNEHRSLNYLAMRYPSIYAKAAEEFTRDFSLSGFAERGGRARPSPLSSTREIVEVVFPYTNPQYRFYGEVLCARGCDRGVPVPCYEAVAIL